MTVFRCRCHCHRDETEGSALVETWGVLTTDPIEAVKACDRCKNLHTPALGNEDPPPQPWTPATDQADGEGAE